MTRPHNAKAVNDDRDDLTNLARQILRDRYRVGAFSNSAFTVHDWCSAADFALEGDFDDLRYMLAEDDRYEAEQRTESRRNGCDMADFAYDNWIRA